MSSLQRRWRFVVVAIALFVAIPILVAPAVIGKFTRDALVAEPLWLAPGLGLEFGVADAAGFYQSAMDVTLAGGMDMVTGHVQLKHNPVVLLSGNNSRWPGWVSGTIELSIEANALARFYRVVTDVVPLAGDVVAAGNELELKLALPPGAIRTPWQLLPVQRGHWRSQTPLDDPAAPIRFNLELIAPEGRIDASGNLLRDNPGLQAQARASSTLATAIAAASVRQQLTGTRVNEAQLQALAKRRVDALVQLGYLLVGEQGVRAELDWRDGVLKINGLRL